jgi:chemotaxis protein CheX
MSRAGKTSKSRAKKTTRSAKSTRTTKSAKSTRTTKSARSPRTTGSTRSAKSSKTGKRLQLPAVLDLTAAAPLAKSLLSRRGAELSVDASRVNRVGAQCLQVLVAAAETWKTDGVDLRLVKPTPEFLEGSRLLGIHLD